jgi:hypothetical protein
MFHAETRPEQQNVRAVENRGVMDYHLFAPKFQNHQDSTGRSDTWKPRHNPELPQTKRDQRVPFPTRNAPMVKRPSNPSTASHPMKSRTPNEIDYRSAKERNEDFNRSIDSMHLPEDLQRPMATRDAIRAISDDTSNKGIESGASEYLENRQFSFEFGKSDHTLPLKGGGNFEDMFY